MSHVPARRRARRDFLRRSAAVAAVVALPLSRSVHAAGSATFNIGLIGCGGRGAGAALNAMNAGPDVRLVAMADLFPEQVQSARQRLQKLKPQQVEVADDHCFAGFDAYRQVLAAGIDVVLIAATSHFHPRMFEAAVAAGKHIFCEKPHALDVPAARRVTAACAAAKAKNLCVVSGLMNRYNPMVRETLARVRDGVIGPIVAIQETYCASPYHVHRRQPQWSELQWQMRDWYHFNWLAGDQCLQQLIHSIDKGAWALGDVPPLKAWGLGGRAACFGESYGDLFDHQAVIFEYASGVRMYGLCRNQLGCFNDLSDVVLGAKGRASLLQGRIEGETNWQYQGPKVNPYDVEHAELFAALRAGRRIDNSGYMVGSTLLALMAQQVCATGRELTWEQLMQSKTSSELDRYDWEIEPPARPTAKGDYDVPIPGITRID